MGEREKGKVKKKAGIRIRKVLFWNVAGVDNKDKDF